MCSQRVIDSWDSVLDGLDRDRALEILDGIADDLRHPPEAWIPIRTAEPFRMIRGLTLGTGSAGVVLFALYLSRLAGRESLGCGIRDAMTDYTRQRLDVIDHPSGFIAGRSGTLWALDFAAEIAGEANADLEAICSRAASELVGTPLANTGGDLWSGLVGYGVFGLQIVRTASGRRLVADVANQLLNWSEHAAGDCPLFSHPELLNTRSRRFYPDGLVNLGVAHGIAGCAGFLALAYHHDLAATAAADLCDRIWTWLSAQEVADDAGTFLPNVLVPGQSPRRGLESWCNGVPGIACVFMMAGRLLEHDDMQAWSLAKAKQMATRFSVDLQLADACLCHGTAGLGHIFNRLSQYTQDSQLHESAASWLKKTMDHQVPGRGVGGYVARGFNREKEICELHEPGLLQGAAGVGLALIAAVTNDAPLWDRALLLG